MAPSTPDPSGRHFIVNWVGTWECCSLEYPLLDSDTGHAVYATHIDSGLPTEECTGQKATDDLQFEPARATQKIRTIHHRNSY